MAGNISPDQKETDQQWQRKCSQMSQPLGEIDAAGNRTRKHRGNADIEYAGDQQCPTRETIHAVPDRFICKRLGSSDTDPFLRRDQVENERDRQDKNNNGGDYKRLAEHWFTSFQ